MAQDCCYALGQQKQGEALKKTKAGRKLAIAASFPGIKREKCAAGLT
jgi:hypothetical protein